MRIAVVGANGRTGRIVVKDALISALGIGTSRAPSDVYSTGVRNTLGAMRSNGAGKLAVISAVPVGPWEAAALLDSLARQDLYGHAAYVVN